MTEVAVPEQIVLPLTGEIVLASDAGQVARALEHMRLLKQKAESAARELTQALEQMSAVTGSRTLHLPDGGKATLSAGVETVYDAEALMEALREAGMPEAVISEVVVETVTYKVDGARAKQAAAANPAYAAAVLAHSRKEPKTAYASLSGVRV